MVILCDSLDTLSLHSAGEPPKQVKEHIKNFLPQRKTIPMPATLIECRERAAEALVPFLTTGTNGDEAVALEAAREAIDAYRPMTPREMQLTAQALALAFAALACLRSAVAGKNLPLKDVLGLQEMAIKLDKQADASTKALEAKRRERQRAPQALTAAAIAWDEATFKRTMTLARRQMEEADAKTPEFVPTPKPRRTSLKIGGGEPMTIDVLIRMANAVVRGAPH